MRKALVVLLVWVAYSTTAEEYWMWGHHPDSFDVAAAAGENYNFPKGRRIDMADGCRELGVDRCCVVRWRGLPAYPYDDYARQFTNLAEIAWSITDSGKETYQWKQDEALRLAKLHPNLTTFFLDDFFCGEDWKKLPPAELQKFKAKARAINPKSRLACVLYADWNTVKPEFKPTLDVCDVVSFWFWEGKSLPTMRAKVEDLRKLIGPKKTVLLGIYLWDFGGKKPLTRAETAAQLKTAEALLDANLVQGLIFHCTPLVDLKLDSVDCAREWLAARKKKGKKVKVEGQGRGAVPFNALRFGHQYTYPENWKGMKGALKKNLGAFDEVWFSTGIYFPKLAWHEEHAKNCAAAAADLRAMGIVPSIEIQTIIGHTDALLGAGDCSGQDWSTWVGADGTVSKHVSCPHDPKLAAYFAKVGELYAAWKPGSMWIDDDVTLRNRAPMDWSKALFGCFCDRCLTDFEKTENRKWSREELTAAIRADAKVAARWEAYQCGNFAALCKTIAAAVHKVSPETVFGYQYGYSGRPAIVKGIYDGCGHPVRLRPGAGAYWDTDAHQQLDKAYQLQCLSELMGHPDWIGERCPEIESCPRTFSCRTPQGIVLEAFENLALGMDNLSMFIAYCGAGETNEYYADRLFPRLKEAMPFLHGYRDANRGTSPCGFTVDRNEPAKLVATRGLPIVGARAKSLGPLPDLGSMKVRMGGSGDVDKKSREYPTRVMQIVAAAELTNFYARCDHACGLRLPARFEQAVMAFALPRVKDDGTLATLAIVNASIDRQEPTKVFLRGLPKGCNRTVWKTPGAKDVVLTVQRKKNVDAESLPRQKDDYLYWVELPAMDAWTCGYLDFTARPSLAPPVHAEFHARDLSKITGAKQGNGTIVAVQEGRAVMPIVYSGDNGQRTQQAVNFLARCIEKATGVRPPIIRDNGDGKCSAAPAFYVGDRVSAIKRHNILAAAGLAEPLLTADIKLEEFAVTAANGSYWFRGRSDHAVYDFCERVLGARWYWSGDDGLYVPTSADLRLPEWSWRDRPVFLMRYNWPDYHTDFGRYLRDSTRGPLALYPELHVHSSGGYKADTNFNFGVRCPEIYELDPDGKRGNQFCFGNPRTLEAYEEIIQKGIDNKLTHISILDFPSKSITVSQLDCGVSCHCAFCKQLYDEKMGPTGNASPCIWGYFVKNLSEWVAEHYPDWTIVILPYINTCGCPEGLTYPRKNVVAMLCTMPGLALLKNDKVREHEEELIRKWAKATGRPVENWHYSCWPNAFTCAPYVYSAVANEHYRRMAKEGIVLGSFLNGGYQANRYFLSVAAWMKSLWNPDFDVRAYHDGFAKRMFGPAARPMRRVLELLENGWNRQWGNTQCSNRNVYEVSYPRAEVEEMERCFAEATELVKPLDAVYLRRINFWREGCAEFFKGSENHAKGSAFEPVRVQKVTDLPKIDGILDDAAWKLAIPTKFVPAFNKDPKAKLRDGGELRAVWTPKGVTFGFRCDEHAIEHFQKTAGKMSFGNETFDIFIDPSGEGADTVCQLVIDARDTIVPMRDEVKQPDMVGFEAKWHVDVPKREWSCELYIPYSVFKKFNGAKFPTTSANGVVWEGNVSRWRIGDSALPKDKRPKDATWEASRLWTRGTWFNKDAAAFGKFMFVE